MSPKRILVFGMLVVSAPVWLLARTRYGERFLALLLVAWSLGFAGLWLVTHGHVPDVPWNYRVLAHYALAGYEASLWLWAAQAAAHAAYWVGMACREFERPHPWYSGSFWLSRYPIATFDMIVGIAAAGMAFSFLQHAPKILLEMAYWGIGIIAGSFFLLAFACFSSGDVLPVKPPKARATRRKPLKRFIARLRPQAKRSREGLGHIFSRRDAALRDLTRT